ncbi:FAD-dependent pyridine nucleotide-disulfide oxidoreductase [Halodesulfurarchaeum formicicum]|uniref:FAD-dependent pyridine nucleotide-disulfide oxidoreductase n=1 Tax=Halodesulfurarchaeum formicicum TaxID=1873524 RepID=A0A1D8S649_9EURY|nr:FAD/NAD(P)-binding oxidoreductase [Halodesulfurarchaeum formicicum]AOW80818.1 FAD-dependent pyridine nucleotide-disulfide oxidoreductase [Halodesulfurarchaeum formicicum]APE96154.1 FAD-dependent pyridine nucleotide-disulfide oxidoreductase [Halodesulfurarchaeum formicicum]
MTTEIAIVGGGVGGTVTANRLLKRLERELATGAVEITLISDNPKHIYKPTFFYVPFGEKEPEDAERPLADLVNRRVDLIYDRVNMIDTDAKTLDLASNGQFGYDYLVVATGAIPDLESTPGFGPDGDAQHFYDGAAATALRRELADFDEGHLVLSVMGTPHVCPAAPVEFTMLADAEFRERGIRDDVTITYTYPLPRLHSVRPVADWAEPRFEERDIQTQTSFNPETVDNDANVIHSLEGTDLEYDLLVGIPEFRSGDLIQAAGLGEEWMEVDKHTLESDHAADVYGLGDVTNIPTSKAGSVAHYAAGTVVDRIAARVRGHEPRARFAGDTICFLEAGMEEGSHISFDYDTDPVVRDQTEFVHWAKFAYNEMYWLTARGLA